MRKPLVLMILDGYGLRESTEYNAVKAANTPNLDRLFATCPHTTLGASGMDVGLPDGQMGNSEVGHTNIGAGRIVYQELTRITRAIADGDFFGNPALLAACGHTKATGGSLHLMGLFSDGGVHSHMDHLLGLVQLAKMQGVEKVYVHCFLDGRDVPPTSGAGYLAKLARELDAIGVGKIASVSGRYYAMDRDNRWERVERAYDVLTGIGERQFDDPVAAVEQSYRDGVTDEFVAPFAVCPEGVVKDGDSVVFYNFRPDRARQLTRAFVDDDFTGFARRKIQDLYYVCMTQYDRTIGGVEVAFGPQALTDTLGEVLAREGLTQLRISETEKYPHVTFFFNGGAEEVFPGEERILIDSPKVATYDLMPEMSAYQVTDALLEGFRHNPWDVVILNYANCDMVGHTGVFDAAVKAVEVVDRCLGKVVSRVLELEGTVLITADHGNADQMAEENGAPFTAHTTNPVPFLVAGKDCELRSGGVLADIAPTVLDILEINKPENMTGSSLICDK